MAEGPTLSDFMRHLQSVLEESTEIPDAEEQEHRQWQIEAAIQEAIIFGNRFRELQEHGLDPLRLIKPKASDPTAPPVNKIEALNSGNLICDACGAHLENDLTFCPACGNER
jgi:hypothetical protein